MSGLFWFIDYTLFIWLGLLLPFIFWVYVAFAGEFETDRDREIWAKSGLIGFMLIISLFLATLLSRFIV
ncbi:MAG TPA: hypothetical protein VJ044_17645 [Candidatus Hodarchaeales archaeon]|nr:hypothetical protein [Candidatus Hodarchaeales archaeon]